MSVNVVSFNVSSQALGKGDNSWLSVLAKHLAKAMTKLQRRMEADGRAMDAGGNKGNQAKADLQVAAKEYSLIVSAIDTVIKTVGQADTALARKN